MIDATALKQSIDLRDLAGRYTRLKRWAARELAGPCPKCGGKDRFHVHASGWWFCRQCHEKRGDAIELVQWLGLADGFKTAVRLLESLGGNVDKLPATPQRQPDRDIPGWQDPAWQKRAQSIVNASIARLIGPGRDGELGRAYLRKRGLEPATWKRFSLGCRVRYGHMAIVVPWVRRGLVEGVFYRLVGVEGDGRFRAEARSERRLFGVDCLQGRPILIACEGEINACSLWQAVGDLADVISFGGESALERPEIVQELREIASRYRFCLLWLDRPKWAVAAREALSGLPVGAMRSPELDGRKLDANACLQMGGLRSLVLDVFERLGLRETPTDALAAYAVQELGASVVEAQWEFEHLPAPLRAVWDALQAKLDDLETRRRKGEALLEAETDQGKRERYTRRLAEIGEQIAATNAELGRLPVNLPDNVS